MSADILASVVKVYEGSDGDATMALYNRLAKLGPAGEIAMNVFRAQKNSARAKKYRGGIPGKGSYKSMAYGRKQWAIENLTKALAAHAAGCGIQWGWGVDPKEGMHSAVLYIDLPTGQVSFHTAPGVMEPRYAGQWDGARGVSVGRVCGWVAKVLVGEAPSASEEAA